MKIHIHTPSFFPQLVGMTYATHVHAELFGELGAEVTVVASGTAKTRSDDAKLPYAVRRFAVSGSGLPWSPVRGDVASLVAFTAEQKPDLVVAQGWFTWGASLLPRMKSHCRHVVLSSHGSADLTLKRPTPPQIGRHLAYRYMEAVETPRIMRSLSAAILLSSYRDDDRFRDGAAFERRGVPTYVCPNPSTYTGVRTTRGDGDRYTLLHIGAMMPHKNQQLAVETLAQLPTNFVLKLAYPASTPYLSEVLAKAERLGVRNRVQLVEGLDRAALEPEFDGSDVLLITSVSEAQPIIASDAMKKGLPFVSTKVGCLPEYEGGIVAVPTELAAAVMEMCSSTERYRRFSADAQAYYERRLSRGTALRSLQALIIALES